MRAAFPCAVLVLIVPFQAVLGQFYPFNSALGPPIYNGPTEVGKALSFHDIDRNGWDDLSIARGDQAPLFLFNDGGELGPAPFSIPNTPAGNINMLLWGDIDNDGDADLLITKSFAPMQLWRNDGNWQFTNIAASAGLEQSNFLYKGAGFCDYDHDGYLDLYITKFYSTTNPGPEYRGILYHNDGDGTFTDVTVSAGVLLPSAPLFQPVFLDYDNDGWEDLFLVVDRTFHQNELFHNNGDGTFSSVTVASGMGIMIDAMSGTVGDPDKDGDLDVFITNDPPEGHAYMVNNGDGTFTDLAAFAGLDLAQVGWGALWLDYDNDTWEDLFVSVTSPVLAPIGNQFFINQQNGTFVASNAAVGLLGDMTETYVCAMGDLNNDGYYDMITNNDTEHPTTLYMNDGGPNHWISMGLQGTLSNRDGVGVWLHCYAGGEHLVRFTLFGSDLMNQNSSRQIFGLGSYDAVDSLVIEWNSGTREVYVEPGIDQHHHFVEGASFLPEILEISAMGSTTLCPGASVTLDAGDFEGYLWNTGDEERFLEVTEPGEYQVTVIDTFGFQIISEPLTITPAPPMEIELVIDGISCYGASDGSITVSISNEPIDAIEWNTGDTGVATLSGLGSGAYSFQLVDSHGCTGSDGAFLAEPPPLVISPDVTDVLCHGEATGSVNLDISGGTPPYMMDWAGMDPQEMTAGVHEVVVMDQNGCSEAVEFVIDEPPALVLDVLTTPAPDEGGNGSASLIIEGGVPGYTIQWSTGEMDVLELDAVAIGEHMVTVTDANQCSSDLVFTVGVATSIPSNRFEGVRIRPTVAVDELFLVGCPAAKVDYRILDPTGSVRSERSGHDPTVPIAVDQLAAGLYVLQVRWGDQAIALPFLRARL